MSEKKLFLVCESFQLGGVQSFYLRLAKAIGNDVCLISLTELIDPLFITELEHSRIDFFHYSRLTQFGLGTQRATQCNSIPLSMKRLSDVFRSSELQFHVSSLSGAVFVHRVARKLGEKYSVKLTVGVYNSLIFGWESSFNSYYSQLSTEILRGFFGANSVLFTNEQSKLSYEEKIGAKCQGELMPVGIFAPKLRTKKLKLNKRKRIVSIGRIVEYKTYNKNLILCLPHLISLGMDFEVHIYGNGEYLRDLQNLVKELSLEDYVSFNGLVKYEDIPKVFKTTDVFVGCGTTLIEASAHGVPSIIGIENMVERKTYGYLTETSGYSFHEKGLDYALFDLSEKIQEVLSLSESSYLELCKNHEKRARDFTIEQSVYVLKNTFKLIERYDASSALSVTRLQFSVMMEQLLAKLGMNKKYLKRFVDASK